MFAIFFEIFANTGHAVFFSFLTVAKGIKYSMGIQAADLDNENQLIVYNRTTLTLQALRLDTFHKLKCCF